MVWNVLLVVLFVSIDVVVSVFFVVVGLVVVVVGLFSFISVFIDIGGVCGGDSVGFFCVVFYVVVFGFCRVWKM